MDQPLLILGAGGHASVLVDILQRSGYKLLGIVSPEVDNCRRVFDGIKHYGNDDDVLLFTKDSIRLVNGVGSLPNNSIRTQLYQQFEKKGYQFETVIAPSAIVSKYVQLGYGVQVMERAIINAGTKIGNNTIINTGAIVEHDCHIGAHNHIAPGVVLSGQVVTADHVHIGTGAKIMQCISIGEHAVIGMGATVYENVPSGYIVYGCRMKMSKKGMK
jgi:sugar O-acyltransferase (sialic acid O-acetyltransferase NeuD family)